MSIPDSDIPLDSLILVDRRLFCFLAHHALIHLWYAAQEEDGPGCCRYCCGVCEALHRLRYGPVGDGPFADQLSDALRGYVTEGDFQPEDGPAWWVNDQINWPALTAIWERFEAADRCGPHDEQDLPTP